MKVHAPNYSPTPNDLFDHWLPHLNESELKVILVIIRKTFGWHKIRDRISISQLQQFTGLSETSILSAIKSLISKGLIFKNTIGPNGKQQTFYELSIEDSNNSYPPSNLGGPPQIMGGTPPDTGETKETNTKETIKEKQQQQPPTPKVVKSEYVIPAAGAAKETPSPSTVYAGTITYKNVKGESCTILESGIFKHFLRSPHSTDLIKEAIEVLKNTPDPIGNVLKFLEAVVARLAHKPPKTKKTEPKQKYIPDHSDIPFEKGPYVKWGDLEKKKKEEKNKND